MAKRAGGAADRLRSGVDPARPDSDLHSAGGIGQVLDHDAIDCQPLGQVLAQQRTGIGLGNPAAIIGIRVGRTGGAGLHGDRRRAHHPAGGAGLGIEDQVEREGDLGPIKRVEAVARIRTALVFEAKVERAVAFDQAAGLILKRIVVGRIFGLEGPLVGDLVFHTCEGRSLAAEPLVGVGLARIFIGDGGALAERLAKTPIAAHPAPAEASRDLQPVAKGLGRRDIFRRKGAVAGEILQTDGQCGDIGPFLQDLVAQVEAAILELVAVAGEQRVPVAPGLEAERPGQPLGDLEADRRPGDRAHQRGREGKARIFLRIARRHVDQAGRAVQVQRLCHFRHRRSTGKGSRKRKKGRQTRR